jgi:hypothetical protein
MIKKFKKYKLLLESIDDRLNQILDKINDRGMESLSGEELKFLNSFKSGKEKEVDVEISRTHFKDDLFQLKIHEIEDFGDEMIIKSTIYVPDIEFNGEIIEGKLDGDIQYYKETGLTSPDFYREVKIGRSEYLLSIFDFCEGYEYELDNFIDYVVSELQKAS